MATIPVLHMRVASALLRAPFVCSRPFARGVAVCKQQQADRQAGVLEGDAERRAERVPPNAPGAASGELRVNPNRRASGGRGAAAVPLWCPPGRPLRAALPGERPAVHALFDARPASDQQVPLGEDSRPASRGPRHL